MAVENDKDEGSLFSWTKLLDSILEKFISLIPWFKHWLNRPVIIPHQRRNWWHLGSIGGKPAMQLMSYWYATNRAETPARILNAAIKQSEICFGQVMIEHPNKKFFGTYPILSGETSEMHADFWIEPPVCQPGETYTGKVIFVDQNGQKRKIKNVKFFSDEVKKPKIKSLKEEKIFQIKEPIEKQVASVLKDEITRYKMFGRPKGELGSVLATYGGKKIKSIYQDSWTGLKSGEGQEIGTELENTHIKSESGDALIKFYKELKTPRDKKIFVESLTKRLDRDCEYYCVSYLILYVLQKLQKLDLALEVAKRNLEPQPSDKKDEFREPHQSHGLSDFLGLLNGLLRFAHPNFTEKELDLIERFVSNTAEHPFRIVEKINSIRAFRLNQ